jgi:hypothetical protein
MTLQTDFCAGVPSLLNTAELGYNVMRGTEYFVSL